MDFVYEICPINKKDETETVERNEVFAQRIQGLDGKVVAVVGLGHVYGIEPTMQTLLKKHNPKDIKLIEADYFDS
jgi:pheromone shutdown protein TraB